MSYTVKFISGEKVYLRPSNESDTDLLAYGKNNEEVRKTLFLFAPVTTDQAKEEMAAWNSSKEIMLFTICRNSDDTAIGQTAFVRIDYVSHAAVFYIAIYDPQYWSSGFGKEAVRLMLKYAFDILNLNRIQLHVSWLKIYIKSCAFDSLPGISNGIYLSVCASVGLMESHTDNPFISDDYSTNQRVRANHALTLSGYFNSKFNV